MPKLDGFEVLELLEREIPVVFITAYDEFALRAFEVRAVDYLLKPFTAERLAEAIGRARERFARPPADCGAAASLVREVRRSRGPLERILVRDGSRVEVIPAACIAYVEAQDDYVRIAAPGRKRLKQQTLNELEGLLDPGRFVRIHRSFLLNLEFLDKIELYAKDSRVAVLKDGTHLPVSRSGYARLRELL
jgi:two-component system LytT family response regulator